MRDHINIKKLKISAWRISVALLVSSMITFVFMKLGGGVMFCGAMSVDDPGAWWRVPMAWVIIYGLSIFVGVIAGAWGCNNRQITLIVFLTTASIFILFRSISHDHGVSYFIHREALYGIPGMLIAGQLARVFLHSLGNKPLSSTATVQLDLKHYR